MHGQAQTGLCLEQIKRTRMINTRSYVATPCAVVPRRSKVVAHLLEESERARECRSAVHAGCFEPPYAVSKVMLLLIRFFFIH